MQTASKHHRKSVSLNDNALARKALEAIQQIDREANEKKVAQLHSLESAKASIYDRIKELNHQLAQIDEAIESIGGRSVPARKDKRPRRSLAEVRERVGRWMQGRKGQMFKAGELVREFPELEGTVMSVFLKPLVESGTVSLDTSEGIRRTKYFVAA